MVIRRGAVHWAELGDPRGSGPGKRRPVLVVQADVFNASRISTVIVAVITSNTRLAEMPGNVFVPSHVSGLSRDSVVNVSQVMTLDKQCLDEPVGELPVHLRDEVDRGLRHVFALAPSQARP